MNIQNNIFSDFNVSDTKANYINSPSKYRNKQVQIANKPDEYIKNDYSADDGKISLKDKLVNFAKGIIKPVTEIIKSPKNMAIAAISAAGCALLIAATGGAAAPILIVAGVTTGGVQLGINAYKASQAKTDDEAKAAWQGMGTGAGIIGGSILGAKKSLQAAKINTDNTNAFKATIECFKSLGKNFKNSIDSIKSGQALNNISNSFSLNRKTKHPKNSELGKDINSSGESKHQIKPSSKESLKDTPKEVSSNKVAVADTQNKRQNTSSVVKETAKPKTESADIAPATEKQIPQTAKETPVVNKTVNDVPKTKPNMAKETAQPRTKSANIEPATEKQIPQTAKETPAANKTANDISETKPNIAKETAKTTPEENLLKQQNVQEPKKASEQVNSKLKNTKSISEKTEVSVHLEEKKFKNLREDILEKYGHCDQDTLMTLLEKNGITKEEFNNYIIGKLKATKFKDPKYAKYGVDNLYDFVFNNIDSVEITPETTFYHGTTKNAAEAIMQEGFDLSKGEHYESGKGIYTVTEKPGPSYGYGDGTCISMKLKNNSKFAKLSGGVTSKIESAVCGLQNSENYITGLDRDVIKNVIVDRFKDMGYAGVQTGTVNSHVPYTVIWDPDSVEFTQIFNCKAN